MTASGLGVTDIGPGNNASYIGGIAKEFYHRVGAAYGSSNSVYYFEPHVAENVFWQMLNEAGVSIYMNQHLASVTSSNLLITQIITEDGSIFRAKEFIDTTYEGDLIAAAGVTFTVGREGTNSYNESLAGIRSPGGSSIMIPMSFPPTPPAACCRWSNPAVVALWARATTVCKPTTSVFASPKTPAIKSRSPPQRTIPKRNTNSFAGISPPASRKMGRWPSNQLIDIQTIIP